MTRVARGIGAALLAALASPASAAELFYTEPLGGVYTQDWSGQVIGPDTFSGIIVYVRGEGKSGDFYGLLSVDCEDAARSKWVSQGGVVRAETVPAAAIDIIRAEACSSP